MERIVRVNIIYAKGIGELFNRQAALGSYIHCLAGVLEKNNFEVFVNGTQLNKLNLSHQATVSIVSNGGKAAFLPLFIKRPLKFLSQLKQINALKKQLLKFREYDVVFEIYTGASNVGYKLAKTHKKPLVILYDSPVQDEYRIFNGNSVLIHFIIGLREKKTILQAKKIIAYSNAVKNYLNSKFRGQFPIFIHQNVDYTRFDIIKNRSFTEPIVIGFIGSFLKWHKVEMLVLAYDRLLKEGKSVHLILLGNGMEYESIKQLVSDLNLAKKIDMPGFVDGEQLFEYKSKMHIGVMPGSNWYGAPNKIFEYGAAGIAVVAPGTPTIKDLFVHDKEIMQFEPDNLNELYVQLKQYVDDKGKMEKHAINLQQKIINNYNESITAEFYKQMLNPE